MMDELSKIKREEYIQQYINSQKELVKYHREYKICVNTGFHNRKEAILYKSLVQNIEQLKREKDDLKAQIWVATAPPYIREQKEQMKYIQCHVTCQEHLTLQNKTLKSEINHLERLILRVDKEWYELNRQTVPDNQHQMFVAKCRKIIEILENQLEVSVRRECIYATNNAALREQLIKLLNERSLFNQSWSKMITQLNSGKKYLIDIVEYASSFLDNAIDFYEKMETLNKREKREKVLRKLEMQGIIRQMAQNDANHLFLEKKAQKRILADLEPREYKRREMFRVAHRKKITLYTKVLSKITSYANAKDVSQVLEKFEDQESLYYSYFNYATELSYHMTLLSSFINELYADITKLRDDNTKKLKNQLSTIEKLQAKLHNEEAKTHFKENEKKAKEDHIQKIFLNFHNILNLVRASFSPLAYLLGNHKDISVFNVKRFLCILEKTLNDVIARVYITQKRDPKVYPSKYIVKDIGKALEEPTALEDIVLVQQCPECAEGEDVNPYDAEYVEPLSIENVKKKLREKVKQPEMQYRLHSISACRLPRSRILASKRH